MGSLNESISEFRRLRKTAKAFHKSAARRCTQHKTQTLPPVYSLVAKHSASFFAALSETWSCLGSTGKHMTHTTRWFLKLNPSDECVNFRMALEYETLAGTSKQRYVGYCIEFCQIQLD